MRIRLLISILVLITTTVFAQDISRQVIGSEGMPINNSLHTINFTVGEPVVSLVQNNVTIH